jgi:23S rRNA A1618 N6-methylase RlmF
MPNCGAKVANLVSLTQMMIESAKYPMQCLWFTTLVSKKENL